MSDEPLLTLFDPDELASFTERARLDVHGGVRGEPVAKGVERSARDEEATRDRDRARLVRGLAGLRLAARCYALARDPAGLRAVVWGAWGVCAWHDRFETHVDSADRIATAVESVGARVLEIPGLAEQLAASGLPRVRRALAAALPETSEALLRALADDDDAGVRKAARAKIADDDRWGGAFPIPPGDHPDEVLAAARAVLDRSAYQRKTAHEEAVRAFAPLSDPLAVACWERVLAPYAVGKEALSAWLGCLLARPGGGEGVARLLAVWSRIGKGYYVGDIVREVRDQVSEEARTRAFGAILEALREDELEARASGDERRSWRRNAEKVAVALAPAQGDARELLETILGCPIERANEEEPDDRDESELSPLLAEWPLDEALRATLVDVRRAGASGRWSRVSRAVWDSLGPDPVLRERARGDLDSTKQSVRDAAITALLGPLHDPAEDGDLESFALALYDRPELRAALLSMAESLLPRARRDLEAGALELDAAIAVLDHTPRDEQTDAMWSAARALRDRTMADPADERWHAHRTIQTLIRPGDEWDPSDLAYARALVERAFGGEHHPGFVALLIGVLERKVSGESEALLRVIDERATTDRLREIVEAGRKMSASLRAIGH